MHRRQAIGWIVAAGLAAGGWNTSAQASEAVVAQKQAAELAGVWVGRWYCDKTGHSGPMRAVIVKTGENTYDARFTGRYFKIVPFNYQTTLTTADAGDHVTFAGASYLSRRQGTYTYSGTATATDLVCHYCSKRHTGRFVMHRCPQACP